MAAAHQIAARHFGCKAVKALALQGIRIRGLQALPDTSGSFLNTSTGYLVDDNGTGRVWTYAEVRAKNAGGGVRPMSDFDWSSLEDHVSAGGAFAPPIRPATSIDAKTEKFPCEACQGTGLYRGVRHHQTESKCFACNGRGYFLTSARDRAATRKSKQARKARKLVEARAAFDEQNPGVGAFLVNASAWSTLADDFLAKLRQYGTLTARQVEIISGMKAKVEAGRAARAAERVAEQAKSALVVDLAPIRAMFETAVGNGHKKPIYRAEGVIISRAPDTGKNPGALYIKTAAGDYLGKIIGTNYSGRPCPALVEIAANPKAMATKYGQQTGTCSCCGAELTNPVSIAAGIGPICAARWGF